MTKRYRVRSIKKRPRVFFEGAPQVVIPAPNAPRPSTSKLRWGVDEFDSFEAAKRVAQRRANRTEEAWAVEKVGPRTWIIYAHAEGKKNGNRLSKIVQPGEAA